MASDAPPTILLDVDGTLVDSNYQHAIAWHRAFREHGYRAAIWEIHRHVGMGGDQFVEALLGEEAEDADGDALRDAHSEAYSKLIGEVEAIEGASELIGELDEAGATVIIGSSAEQDECDHYVELLGVGEKIAGRDDLRRRRAQQARSRTGAGRARQVRLRRPGADDR